MDIVHAAWRAAEASRCPPFSIMPATIKLRGGPLDGLHVELNNTNAPHLLFAHEELTVCEAGVKHGVVKVNTLMSSSSTALPKLSRYNKHGVLDFWWPDPKLPGGGVVDFSRENFRVYWVSAEIVDPTVFFRQP